MGELLCILSVAVLIAVIICIGIVTSELKKTNKESIHKQLEVSKQLEQEALDEILNDVEEEDDE